ncbi:MAG: rhodanese-like domain-containing protein [Spirochaetes bacterium]|nr:rhodanese-like domain-containing protein [Spirochaetota bacterium]
MKSMNSFMFGLLLIFINSCGFAMEENISAEEAYQLIQDNKNNSDFVILDVRTSGEYNDGYIKDAENIDYYGNDFEDNLKDLDKDKTYLIYCRSGNRSSKTLKIMKNLGFDDLSNMLGGIGAWQRAGYPLVKP